MLKTYFPRQITTGDCYLPLNSHIASEDDEVGPRNLWIFLFHRPEQLASLPKVGIVIPAQLRLKPFSFLQKITCFDLNLILAPSAPPLPSEILKIAQI